MPVVGNMGYLLYILLAIVGAAVSLAGVNDIGLTGVKRSPSVRSSPC